MGQRSLPSLRHAVPLAAIALLVGCGVAGPSPARERELPGIRAPGGPETTARVPYLLLRLGERRLYLMDDDPGTPVESFPIAVGRDGLETPTGRFHVEEMLEHPEFLKFDQAAPRRVIKRIPPGRWNPLGERWIGFAHGEGWTLGIHGTPNPELLGHAVSHGCVRMRNADVVRIYERIQLGTPVIVEP